MERLSSLTLWTLCNWSTCTNPSNSRWLKAAIKHKLPSVYIQETRITNFPTITKPQARKAEIHNHPIPKPHDCQLVLAYISSEPSSLYWHICRTLVLLTVRVMSLCRTLIWINSNRKTCRTFHDQYRSRFSHLNRKIIQCTCKVMPWLHLFSMVTNCQEIGLINNKLLIPVY